MFEVLTAGGEHILVPIERIAALEFDAPRRPRDLCWRRTTIELRDGTDGVVYAPAIYPGGAGLSDALKLGRATEWGERAPVRGQGQRMFLVGEEAVALADLKSVRFA